MKKYLLIALFVIISNNAFSQWYGGVSPQVYYDPCVQAAIQAAQSSNWVMQNNQMIMQQQQMMINNGWYSTPSYNQNSTQSTESRSSRKQKVCGACGGKGWIPETKGVASYGQTKWCSRCEKEVPSNHYHATCPSCNGTGKW